MQTAAEYREEATGYVRQAEAGPADRRLGLLEMAQRCLRLADRLEFLENRPRANADA